MDFHLKELPITCFICGCEAGGVVKEVPQAQVNIWREESGEREYALCKRCCSSISNHIAAQAFQRILLR